MDGVAKLTALRGHAMELTRKICMYCSEGSGKWGVDDSVGTAAELKEKRLELRRRLVQFSVLASMDLRRELKSDKVSMDVDADGEVQNPVGSSAGAPEGYTRINLPSGTNEMWLSLAAESKLFEPIEVEDYRNAGPHFVPLAARNLESALFPLFQRKHFPHVNMLRECLAHVKGMSSVWSDCATTATTPIPFPYIQLAKIFTFMFLYTLPFALVQELGWLTMLAVLVLALGYCGLDAIATEMEQPFGTDLNDLPMMEVVESIEKGSRVLLGQLEREELEVYEVRKFYSVGSL